MGLLKSIFSSNNANDERKLHSWLSESTQNKAAVQSLLQQDNPDLSFLQSYTQFDTTNAWNKIESQIDFEEKRNYSNIYKIAAVGAVLLVSAFAWNQMNVPNANSHLTTINAEESLETVHLPDGSIAYLDKQSALSFDEKEFENERQVNLTGRAFFEVTKSEGKNFIVQADNLNVEVLGTRFEVNAKTIVNSVTVEEGKVKVFNDMQSVILTANEKALIERSNIQEVKALSTNMISWKKGVLNFNDTKMSTVIKDLEDHFAIDIEVDQSSSDTNCPLTSVYQNEGLTTILEEIKQNMGASYKIEKNKVYISDLCN